jgi:phenylacetate-coenzyme A ligase PaaK-like adenylate-forming protein
MRERIQEAWGIDPGEYYATTEAPTLACSTPQHPRALELFEDVFVVEIVDEHDRPVPPGTAGAKVRHKPRESHAAADPLRARRPRHRVA